MPDYGHRFTDKELKKLEKEVAEVYRQAKEEAEKKLADYFRRFEIKDGIWAERVAAGEKTAAEYAEWRKGQLIVGERWKALSEKLAEEYHASNLIARDIVLGHRAAVYAENFNFATWQVEKGVKASTGFTLYSKDAVERVLRDNPELLPPPGVNMQGAFAKFDSYKAGKATKLSKQEKKAFDKLLAEGKDVRWQEGKLQSATMQAILQGESIPNFAGRIARTMSEVNHSSTIRYARTAMNGAQNAGRVDAFHRAEELGVEMEQTWLSVLDGRTRYEHRQLDGQKVPVGEPFEVNGYKIMYPGDPTAAPEMIWNCRCGIFAAVKGWQHHDRRSHEALAGQSYEEWKNDHKSISHSITKQEEIGEAMKWKYINEDYKT